MNTPNLIKTSPGANVAQPVGILETFGDPELVKMVNAVLKWVGDACPGQPHYWLTLSGKSDIGKTRCAKFAWNRLQRCGFTSAIRSNYDPAFIYWPRFVADLRVNEEARQIAIDTARWPILILDDIGSERDTTGFAAEQLMVILGAREGRHTLLTTNLTIDQLVAIDARLASRIMRGGNRFMQINTTTYYERTH